MAINLINLGGTANDGTGDSLRSGGQKINDNFIDLSGRTETLESASISGLTQNLSYSDGDMSISFGNTVSVTGFTTDAQFDAHTGDTVVHVTQQDKDNWNAGGNQDDFNAHTGDTTNPHQVTATQVGLGNVDNTSDLNKPISTATQSALDGKVDDAQVLTNVPSGATFTDTIYDDTAIQGEIDAHTGDTANPHSVTKTQVGLDQVDNTSDLNKPVSTATQTALNLKANNTDLANYQVTSEKGNANGYAELDGSGLVPASQLPTYVSDVQEYTSTSFFPATGESGVIYIALDTNVTYRWSGTIYVIISATIALGETSSTAYRGDRGATAYNHTSLTNNPHSVDKTQVGLSNVDNTSDANKPVSTATQTALDGKVDDAQVLTNVPSGAVFTDTVYDDSAVLKDSDTVSPVTGINKIITQNDVAGLGGGDMLKSVYDTDNNGIVDNAEKVNNLTVETAVPAGALFTDTAYDDTAIQAEIDSHTGDTTNPHQVTLEQARAQNNQIDGDVNFSGNSIQAVNEINFNTVSGNTAKIYWDEEDYAAYVDNGLGHPSHINRDMEVFYLNNTGSLITKGTVLSVVSAANGEPTVILPKADLITDVGFNIMVAKHDVANGDKGTAISTGRIYDLDTSGYIDGDILYLSDTVAGGLTNIKPSFPSYPILVGGVVVGNDVINGKIVVSPRLSTNEDIDKFWNGVIRESFKVDITSNGTTITATLSPKQSVSFMTMMFDEGRIPLASGVNVTLIPGTNTVPVTNYVSIPTSTKVLTVSTSGWPGEPHIKVGDFLVQSATGVQAYGVYKHHLYNDHFEGTDGQGHLSHITERIRLDGAKWVSGAECIPSTDGTNVYLTVTGGVVYQLHKKSFPGINMSTGDGVYVVNDFTTPYVRTTNLNTITTDSAGGTLTNKSFSIVVWGSQNSDGTGDVYINIPSGTYSKTSPIDAETDLSNYANYTIPNDFNGTSFLIAKVNIVYNGGTYSIYSTEDLRSTTGVSGGSGGGTGGGAITFLGLTDTPSSFVGSQYYIPRVNITSDSLEFVDPLTVVPAPTGLEQLDEGNGIGLAKIGRDPSHYGTIGQYAVDLSYNNFATVLYGALGQYSFAAGYGTRAKGLASTSIGNNTYAPGTNSFAAGTGTIASGPNSFAQGTSAQATGSYAVSLGNQSKATNYYTFATGGGGTISSGEASAVFNYGNKSVGSRTTSFGNFNYATGYASFMIGNYANNYSTDNKTVFTSTNVAFAIGNGTSDVARSDAFTVLFDGTITAPSTTTGMITTAGAKSLITKEYADANYGGGGGATILSDLTDVVSATNTNGFALMANGTTGYVGRAIVSADISDFDTSVSANADVTANSAKISYTDATKVGYISVTQAVDLDTMESDIATNNGKVSATGTELLPGDIGVTVQGYDANIVSDASYVHTDNNFTTIYKGYVDANNAKTGITATQASQIVTNNAKISYPSVDSTKVGFISVTQSVDLDTMESNISTNNGKLSATGTEVEPTDIDTLAKVNAIITDATLIDTTDSRLSDVRTPSDASVTLAKLAPELTGVSAIAALDVDWSNGIQFTKTLTSNTVLTFSNYTVGKTITLVINGAFTLDLPTGVDVAEMADYDSAKTNYIQIYCADATTPVFLVSIRTR